jgi:hypothetical protein
VRAALHPRSLSVIELEGESPVNLPQTIFMNKKTVFHILEGLVVLFLLSMSGLLVKQTVQSMKINLKAL